MLVMMGNFWDCKLVAFSYLILGSIKGMLTSPQLWAIVVAQWSFPTPKVFSSNPILWQYLLSTVEFY